MRVHRRYSARSKGERTATTTSEQTPTCFKALKPHLAKLAASDNTETAITSTLRFRHRLQSRPAELILGAAFRSFATKPCPLQTPRLAVFDSLFGGCCARFFTAQSRKRSFAHACPENKKARQAGLMKLDETGHPIASNRVLVRIFLSARFQWPLRSQIANDA